MLQSSVTFSTAQESDLSIKSLKKCVNSVECFFFFLLKKKKKKKKKTENEPGYCTIIHVTV
jgi:hypothetical protein